MRITKQVRKNIKRRRRKQLIQNFL